MSAHDTLIEAYRRILKAAEKGVGVRLSADEVWEMSRDNAIEAAVLAYDDPDPRSVSERWLETVAPVRET